MVQRLVEGKVAAAPPVAVRVKAALETLAKVVADAGVLAATRVTAAMETRATLVATAARATVAVPAANAAVVTAMPVVAAARATVVEETGKCHLRTRHLGCD